MGWRRGVKSIEGDVRLIQRRTGEVDGQDSIGDRGAGRDVDASKPPGVPDICGVAIGQRVGNNRDDRAVQLRGVIGTNCDCDRTNSSRHLDQLVTRICTKPAELN